MSEEQVFNTGRGWDNLGGWFKKRKIWDPASMGFNCPHPPLASTKWTSLRTLLNSEGVQDFQEPATWIMYIWIMHAYKLDLHSFLVLAVCKHWMGFCQTSSHSAVRQISNICEAVLSTSDLMAKPYNRNVTLFSVLLKQFRVFWLNRKAIQQKCHIFLCIIVGLTIFTAYSTSVEMTFICAISMPLSLIYYKLSLLEMHSVFIRLSLCTI